jgi:AdoMet-dependent heme synthase
MPADGRPPLVVAWEVTRACPLACRHCRAAAQHRPHPAELTHDEGLALIDDLAAAFPGAVLILTGGEPLTRPDTLALAEAGTRRGLRMALSVDVGRLLTPETCAAIRAAGVKAVSFSLHFPDAERADAFASTSGFYEGALEGLANLRRAGQHFQLHTTVMRSNAALLPRLHGLAGELGAGAWELFFLVPTGRGRRSSRRFATRRILVVTAARASTARCAAAVARAPTRRPATHWPKSPTAPTSRRRGTRSSPNPRTDVASSVASRCAARDFP